MSTLNPQLKAALYDLLEPHVRKALQDGAELMKQNRLFGGYREIKENTNNAIAALQPEIERLVESKLNEALDFGSWLTGMCDLHKKYTSACGGCQRESAKLNLLDDYQGYIVRLTQSNQKEPNQ